MKIVENANMKLIKDKKLLVGADNSGSSLKNVIVAHLRKKGWEIEDVGAMSPEENNPDNMFHRVGLRVGAKISEGEYERALIFCGTGMGIHIAASKCPHVHAAVVESVPAGLRAITGNNVNVLAMGAFMFLRRWASKSPRRILRMTLAAVTNGGIISLNFISWQ